MAVTLHTSLGDLKFEIFCDTAPRTSFNFLALAASGYYNGTTFHRNIRGFMIQGGDPTGMVVRVRVFVWFTCYGNSLNGPNIDLLLPPY